MGLTNTDGVIGSDETTRELLKELSLEKGIQLLPEIDSNLLTTFLQGIKTNKVLHVVSVLGETVLIVFLHNTYKNQAYTNSISAIYAVIPIFYGGRLYIHGEWSCWGSEIISEIRMATSEEEDFIFSCTELKHLSYYYYRD